MNNRLSNRISKHIWKLGRWFRRGHSKVSRHPAVWERKLAGSELSAVCISPVVEIDVEGRPGAHHWYGNAWWTSIKCPYAFQYPNLSALYAAEYYVADPVEGGGHPSSDMAHDLIDYMSSVYEAVFRRPITSILELGSGAGEITREFVARGWDSCAVEGTLGGVTKLRELGIPEERVIHCDLKQLKDLGRKWDIVMCTEVAEHVEPWFACKIVEACVAHGDVVWFSAAEGFKEPCYYHMNEVPLEAWDNIFAYMGFPISIKLDGRHDRADRLYVRQGCELPALEG